MLNPENLDETGQTMDEVEEAPWFQAHWAELGSTSGRRQAGAARRAGLTPVPRTSGLTYLGVASPVDPIPRVA